MDDQDVTVMPDAVPATTGGLRILLHPVGDSALPVLEVQDGELLIGRKAEPFAGLPANSIAQLSRQHARVYEEDGNAYVADLGSSNGTYLNNQKLGGQPVQLNAEDDLAFGGAFRFSVELQRHTIGDQTVLLPSASVVLNLVPAHDPTRPAIVIDRFPFMLGRSTPELKQLAGESDIESLKMLSRKHALITQSGHRLFIEDQGSANGTYIENQRVDKPCPIGDGDEIRLASDTFVFQARVQTHDEDRTVFVTEGSAADGASPAPLAGGPVHQLNLAAMADAGLIIGDAQPGAQQEFQRIKRSLILSASSQPEVGIPKNLIMITSSTSGEGKTFVALNLALSMATEKDYYVLLVDADTAKRDLSLRLGVKDKPGFIDVLKDGRSNVGRAILRTNLNGLSLLPGSSEAEHCEELIASNLMGDMLHQLATQDPKRMIIFDGPPLIQTTEAAVLARAMGQTVLVVEANKTPTTLVEQALAQIQTCQSVSVLLNKTSGGNPATYFYGT